MAMQQEQVRVGEQFSGVVVVLLDADVPPGTDADLIVHARRSGLDELVQVLFALGNPPTGRQVTSVPVAALLEAERARLEGPYPPLRSLTRYWRVDVAQVRVPVEEAVPRLGDVRGVVLAYAELVVTEPSVPSVTPADDPKFVDQGYLRAAPEGVDAVAAWKFRGGAGEGVRFVDVEEGWRLTHEDLDGLTIPLLCNTNRDGRNGFPADHGTATLGVVAGVDNTVGGVGIVPRLDAISVASHFKPELAQIALHVVDALSVVALAVRPGDVVLLEIQRSGLPTETQFADFDAIRLVAGTVGGPTAGVVVVEAAGNGDRSEGVDLDVPQGPPLAGTQWWATRTDDCGAILVGAAASVQAEAGGHACRDESNYGVAVHCHAWGDSVHTAAAKGYTDAYGGTSAASAIVAGVAASVQGMHRAAHGVPLVADDLRAMLADAALGTAQHTPPAHPIGPMPDLAKLAAAIGAVV